MKPRQKSGELRSDLGTDESHGLFPATIAVWLIMRIGQQLWLSFNSKAIKEALAMAGAWGGGNRDWNEVEAELDRIRHSSKPTPPFAL